MQIWAQSDLKTVCVLSPIQTIFLHKKFILTWLKDKSGIHLSCGIWNHRFNKLRRHLVYCSKMVTAVLVHSIYLVRNHVNYSKNMWGINLTTTTSLPELEETQLFLTSEIQTFEISPLFQHPVLSLERICNFSGYLLLWLGLFIRYFIGIFNCQFCIIEGT